MAMIARGAEHIRIFRHGHLFCGIGAGAQGFNQANPRIDNLVGRFVCAGGIDNDPGAIANFERMTGVPGTVLDLFDEDQYRTWHGKAPPAGWREAMPDDVRRVFGDDLDVIFTSAPCKGFSGLLSSVKSKTDKYQALNRLTVRGMWLLLEAYKDSPVPIILFENVPRIMTRGRPLLEEIKQLLRAYGYIVNEDVHDCGEIGELAQTRKRFLLIARHPLKIPGFVYQPTVHKLRGVGEVIGKLPLPGDPVGGIMHRVPMLQWQTWVRLAFVEAGKDWRSLNNLRVENGVLQDYGLVPEGPGGEPLRDNALGVSRWSDTAPVITGNQRSPYHGRWSVADPRPADDMYRTALGVTEWSAGAGTIGGRGFPLNGAYSVADPRPGYGLSTHRYVLGVKGWTDSSGVVTANPKPSSGPNAVADPRVPKARNTAFGVVSMDSPSTLVAGESLPSNGAYAVADPRPPADVDQGFHQYGVNPWNARTGAVSGQSRPGGGVHSVADPRIDGHHKSVQLGVRPWSATAPCLKGDMSVGGGPYAIADVRIPGKPLFNNCYRVVRYEDPGPAVAGPGGAGGLAVADPRAPETPLFKKNKYRVTGFSERAGSVIAASTTGDGAFAVADPRGGERAADLHGKYRVEVWIGPASRAVIAGRDNGAFAVADPRCKWGNQRHEAIMRVTPGDQPVGTIPANAHSVTGGHPCVADQRREHYQTGGHFGVLPWNDTAYTVSSSACHDNGFNSVADPRRVVLEPAEPIRLPAPTQKLICRIVSLDGTWHRPFTTLELASLQSLFDPEEAFYQDQATGIWVARKGFELEGGSDATRREWIGNAVPSAASRGMAETIGEVLLASFVGKGFQLSTRKIWVQPGAMALAVDSRQPAYDMDLGRI